MDTIPYTGKLRMYDYGNQKIRAYGFSVEFLLATVFGFGFTMLGFLLVDANNILFPSAVAPYVQAFIWLAALIASMVILTIWAERVYGAAHRLQSFYRNLYGFFPMLFWCTAFGGCLYLLLHTSAQPAHENALLWACGTTACALVGLSWAYYRCNKGLLDALRDHWQFKWLHEI